MALFDVVLTPDSLSAADSVLAETLSDFDVHLNDQVNITDALAQPSLELNPILSDSIMAADAVLGIIVETLYPVNVRALSATRLRVDFSTRTSPTAPGTVPGQYSLSEAASYLINPLSPGAALVVPLSVSLPVGQTFPLFVEIETTEMTDGAVYSLALSSLILSDVGEPAISTPAFFAGIGDPPDIFVVIATDKNTCEVRFTEPMLDNAALRDTDNYSFDKGLLVTAVQSVEGSIVTLKTSDQTPGEFYTLTVRGLLAATFQDQVTAVDSVIIEINVVSGYPTDAVSVTDQLIAESDLVRSISDSISVVEAGPTLTYEVDAIDILSPSDSLATEADYARGIADTAAVTDSVTPELTSPASTPDVILAGNQLAWHRWDLGVTQTVPPDVDGLADQFTAYNLDLAPAFGEDPNYVASGGLNGNGYLHFDKSNQEHLFIAGTGIMPASITPHVFMVMRFHTPPTADQLFTIGQSNLFAPNNEFMYLRADTGIWQMACRTGAGFFFLQPAASYDANWHLIEMWYDGANLNMRIDGGSTQSVAANGTMNVSLQTCYAIAAAVPGGGSTTGNIDFGEMIAAANTISGATRSAIISYLNSIWAGGWS